MAKPDVPYYKPIHPSVLPEIKWLFEEIKRQGRSMKEVAETAGYAVPTLHGWKQGRYTPSLAAFRDCANVLGFQVVVVAEGESDGSH